MDAEAVANLIRQELALIGDMLCEKNRAYGNSALNPVRIFSKADAVEGIRVRIDDKLSRFIRGHAYPGDNDELDLIGYLVLKRIAMRSPVYSDFPKPGGAP